MSACEYFIYGDPERPCARAAGHRSAHRDAAAIARQRAYYHERYRDRQREMRRSPEHRKLKHARDIRLKYGISAEEYATIKKFQGGKCAICQIATGRTRRLSVDHDHKTREVRGLLCSPCNHMLGHLRDSPDALKRGLEYLFSPPAAAALGRLVYVPKDSPAQQPRKRVRRK